MAHGVPGDAQEVGILVRFGQVQHDAGTRGDCVRPQDVQRDLLRPATHVVIGRIECRESVRGDLGEPAELGIVRIAEPIQARQAVEGVEVIQLRHDVRGLEGVDDDDRLASAREAGLDQRVDAVSVPHLIRVIAGTGGEPELAVEQAVAGT